MSCRSGVFKDVTVAALVVVSMTSHFLIDAQTPRAAAETAAPSRVRLPNEAAGIDRIAQALISAFDQVDIVALGEHHGRTLDSDLRMAVVRHPDFARKVRFIVVEFGSTAEQATLDRYIRGENVSRTELERIWKTTSQSANRVWESPVYASSSQRCVTLIGSFQAQHTSGCSPAIRRQGLTRVEMLRHYLF